MGYHLGLYLISTGQNLLIFWFLWKFFKPKVRLRNALLFNGGIVNVAAFLVLLFGFRSSAWLHMLVNLPLYIAFGFYMAREYPRKVSGIALCSGVLASMDLLAFFIVFGEDFHAFMTMKKLIFTMSISCLFILIFGTFILQTMGKFNFRAPIKHPGLLAMIILLQIILLSTGSLIVDYAEKSLLNAYFILTIILFSCMNLLLIRGTSEMARKEVLEQRMELLKHQQDVEYSFIKERVIQDEKYNKYHHDIRNNLSVILTLLKDQNQEKGLYLLNTLVEEATSLEKEIYSNHPVINAVLNHEKVCAKKLGIQMEIDAMASVDIGIDDRDICSLYCNLLDNAIEACLQIEEPELRRIKCITRQEKGILIIKTTNPYHENPDSDKSAFKRKKEGVKGSGFGMKIIREIAGKYCGQLRVVQENGFFNVTIFLDIIEKQNWGPIAKEVNIDHETQEK